MREDEAPPIEELLTDPVEEIEGTGDGVDWPQPAQDPAEEPAESLANDGFPGALEE